jgi:hypothetical protein
MFAADGQAGSHSGPHAAVTQWTPRPISGGRREAVRDPLFGRWMRPRHRKRQRRARLAPPQHQPTAGAPLPPLTDMAVTPKQAELTDILDEITHLKGRVWFGE